MVNVYECLSRIKLFEWFKLFNEGLEQERLTMVHINKNKSIENESVF